MDLSESKEISLEILQLEIYQQAIKYPSDCEWCKFETIAKRPDKMLLLKKLQDLCKRVCHVVTTGEHQFGFVILYDLKTLARLEKLTSWEEKMINVIRDKEMKIDRWKGVILDFVEKQFLSDGRKSCIWTYPQELAKDPHLDYLRSRLGTIFGLYYKWQAEFHSDWAAFTKDYYKDQASCI